MANITRLTTTGSAGFNSVAETSDWESDKKRINMFKIKDLYPMFLRMNSHVRGLILPAFDPDLSINDLSRQMSVGSYRTTAIDPKTSYNELSAWMITVKGYSYYGNNCSTFISPSMVGEIDPIIELRKEVYRRKNRGDNSLEWLVKAGPAKTDKTYLPGTTGLTLMNVWSANTNEKAKDAQEVKNRILVLKQTAVDKLINDLNDSHPAAIAVPRDPNWKEFLFGDITDPSNAVEWGVTSSKTTNGGAAAVLTLGNKMATPQGMVLNCVSKPIPQEALAGRYDLADLVNVLHIPTTEEVIELLVDEGAVPYEFICDVCGQFISSMPEQKTNKRKNTENEYVEKPQTSAAPYAISNKMKEDHVAASVHEAPVNTVETKEVSGLTEEENAELDTLLQTAKADMSALNLAEIRRLQDLLMKKNSGK